MIWRALHEYVNFVHDPEKQYRSSSEWSATGVIVRIDRTRVSNLGIYDCFAYDHAGKVKAGIEGVNKVTADDSSSEAAKDQEEAEPMVTITELRQRWGFPAPKNRDFK